MNTQHTPTPFTPRALSDAELHSEYVWSSKRSRVKHALHELIERRKRDSAHDELVARCEEADRQHVHAMRVMLDIRDELAAAAREFRIAYYPLADGDKSPKQRELCERLDAALAKAGAL